jgi:hypothetical protein
LTTSGWENFHHGVVPDPQFSRFDLLLLPFFQEATITFMRFFTGYGVLQDGQVVAELHLHHHPHKATYEQVIQPGSQGIYLL